MPTFQVHPVENTQSDRDQVAKVLITAMFNDAYYRAIYPNTPLPDLIHYASLRLGVNLQRRDAWFLKSVLASPPTSSSVATLEHSDIRFTEIKQQQQQQQEQDRDQIASYARYILPARLIEQLEQQHPRRPLTEEEKVRYERDLEMGTNGEGDPRGIKVEVVDVVGPAMARAREAFPTEGKENISLDMLATLPSHQGQGSATQVIEWGTALADREGLMMVLEATDGKEGFYERFGFHRVSEARHDLRGWLSDEEAAEGLEGGEGGFYTHVFMVREPRAVVKGAKE